MFSIKVILLQKSISEIINENILDVNLYCVLFYKPSIQNKCNEIYLLEKNTKPYISEKNKTIKMLYKI